MQGGRHGLVGIGAVLALTFSAAPAALADTKPSIAAEAFSLKVLSPADARAYATAFALTQEARFDDAEAAIAGVDDTRLKGRLAFARLMHSDYRSTFDELADWLKSYRDQPEAGRVYNLALKRRPDGSPAPLAPNMTTASAPAPWSRVEAQAARLQAKTAAAKTPTTDSPSGGDALAARETFYAGDVTKAYALANKAGERWIAGLAAFQLDRPAEARSRFAALADDDSQDEWVRSAAAYWAARSAIAAGEPEAAPAYLAQAARTPYTFYGLIAERQLGLEPAVSARGMNTDPIALHASPAPAVALTGADGAAVAKLVKSDKRAGRAAAFAQLGMRAEAGLEVRDAMQPLDAAARKPWVQLALALNVPITTPADLTRRAKPRFDLAQFPTPDLTPNGGFTIDRALVYALVKQESRFNPQAQSGAGAHGLMQIMPATAARVAGDDKFVRNPAPLKDPAVNLRIGQDYVSRLLGALDGDILHTVAAYNSGPGTIMKTLQRLGKDGDSLMAVESMPGLQTRDFVQKVMASYWIYRNIFGQDSKTLDAVASSSKAVLAGLDVPGPAQRAEATILSSFFGGKR